MPFMKLGSTAYIFICPSCQNLAGISVELIKHRAKKENPVPVACLRCKHVQNLEFCEPAG